MAAILIPSGVDLAKGQLQRPVFHLLASAPSAPAEGQAYWDTADHRLYLWNGSAWVGADASDVDLSTVVAKSLFDAQTILIATADNTPVALTVAEATIVGRATGGDITALTATQVRTILNVEDGADVTDATNVDAAGATMNSDTSLAGNGYFLDEDSMASDSAVKVPSQQSVKAYVDAQISATLASEMSFKGDYNAATNTPDLDTSPSGVKKGDTYVVTAAGTFFTTAVEIGDTLIAKVDSADAENEWVVVQANLTAASIKTLYESNADTNAFTDAAETKLGTFSGGKYAVSFGDGAATTFTITHNLNTRDVVVSIRLAATPYSLVITDWAAATVNTITVDTGDYVPGTDELRAVIVG